MALAFLSGADLAPIPLYCPQEGGRVDSFSEYTGRSDAPSKLSEVPRTQNGWKHLEAHPQSSYKQLFLKGTRLRAEVIYAQIADGDPPPTTTPEEIAEYMNLPLEAVREAIAYCEADPPEIEEDHRREREDMQAQGLMDAEGNYIRPPGRLSPEEEARLGLNDE
jgi:uncharacterized protein (DUF433 family)